MLTSHVRILGAALLVHSLIVSVTSQATCGVLQQTSVTVAAGAIPFEATADECCITCQAEAACTVSVFDSAANMCIRITVPGGGMITANQLVNNSVNMAVFFPDGMVQVAPAEVVSADQGDLDLPGGLDLPAIAGIIGGAVGLCCIVATCIAFFRARKKQRVLNRTQEI